MRLNNRRSFLQRRRFSAIIDQKLTIAIVCLGCLTINLYGTLPPRLRCCWVAIRGVAPAEELLPWSKLNWRRSPRNAGRPFSNWWATSSAGDRHRRLAEILAGDASWELCREKLLPCSEGGTPVRPKIIDFSFSLLKSKQHAQLNSH